MSKPIRVYADVVADLFHRGHVEFFKKLKSLYENTHVIIGVQSDKTTAEYKRKPIFCMDDRAEIIRNCKFVDEIILDPPFLITEEFIKLHKIDIVAHGNDMTEFLKTHNYPIPIKLGIMRTVPRWEGISSTEIIKKIERKK
jgi:choline-phosphate cytidylyltransferase